MKKVSCLCLSIFMMLTLAACGSNSSQPAAEDGGGTVSNTGDETEGSENQSIQTEENLFDVEITIPADIMGEEITQEELDETVAGNDGVKSVVLNADGSATYTMTKAAHADMVKEIAAEIDATLDEMVSSADYTFTQIEHNEDYTKFTVITDAAELGLADTISTVVFYMCGGMYGAFSGNTPDNIQVDFVNAATGEIIDSANSKDMA